MISPGRIIEDRDLWTMANTADAAGVTPLEFFQNNIALRGDFNCWEWQGSVNKYGYGRMRVGSDGWFTHRFSYEIHRGSALSLQLDHLCRNRLCCNPWHLEPVTAQVNKLRAYGFGGRRWEVTPTQRVRRRPPCPHNFPLPSKCRDCRKTAKQARREGQKKYWERVRAERSAERVVDASLAVTTEGVSALEVSSSEGQVRASEN